MRNISTQKTGEPTAPTQPVLKPTGTRKKALVCQLSEPLITKCRNLLQSKHLAGDYTYSNVSDLIRQSLESYRTGTPLVSPRPLTDRRKYVGLTLTPELMDFYQTLPAGHRTEILERCLVTYLNNI
jgi:hypothetical protein